MARTLDATSCTVHGGTPSVMRCRFCGRGMCGECFRFLVGTDPACVLCAREVATRKRRRGSLAVAVALVGLGSLGFLHLRGVLATLGETAPWLAGGVVLGSVVLAGIIAASGRFGDAKLAVKERGDADVTVSASVGSPYRAYARRVVAAASPPVSATSTALVVGTAMVLSGIAIPAALRLPVWLDIEGVVGAAFLILSTTLAVVLYRGHRLDDDHFYYRPELPWRSITPTAEATSAQEGKPAPVAKASGGCTDPGCSGCDPGCGDSGELVLFLAAVVVVLVGVVALAWVVVEVSLPLVFLGFYQALVLAIRRAARDGHGCKGSLVRSIAWATAWAALYLAPVALLVWGLRRALGHA